MGHRVGHHGIGDLIHTLEGDKMVAAVGEKSQDQERDDSYTDENGIGFGAEFHRNIFLWLTGL